jgi:putative tryptophan/tyrosine transport system substrate-binding protein
LHWWVVWQSPGRLLRPTSNPRAHPNALAFLTTSTEGDPVAKGRLAIFRRALAKLGWTEGANILIKSRWGAANDDRVRTYAAELVGLNPDVILANGYPSAKALLAETRVVPIVFVLLIDPVGEHIVASLASPGGNITGFTNVVEGMERKWLELLKEVAPSVVRWQVNPTSGALTDLIGYRSDRATRGLCLSRF